MINMDQVDDNGGGEGLARLTRMSLMTMTMTSKSKTSLHNTQKTNSVVSAAKEDDENVQHVKVMLK